MLAYAVARETTFAVAIAGIGALGAVFLVFVLLGRSEALLVWALACLGAAYVLSLVARGGSGVDEGVPLVATGLLACGELAAWSRQERGARRVPFAVTNARAVAVAALTFAGLAASTLVLAVSAVPTGAGLAWTVLGAAAAVGVLGVAVRLAQHAR